MIGLVRASWLERSRPNSDAGRLPDLDLLGRRFAPDPAAVPDLTVVLVPLHLYDELGTVRLDGAA
jgi:hypothetical protein